MPRVGLTPAAVIAAAADLADEVGSADATLTELAERVGVRTPSLYEHVAGQGDLNRRVATLAHNEAADAIGTATQGRAGRDALGAAARALRDFVQSHPGRYAATIGLAPTGPDDPMAIAEARGLGAFRAVLLDYDIVPGELPHALRALRSVFHGIASLRCARGFRWSTDVDESFDWLIDLVDRGLRASGTVDPTNRQRTAPWTARDTARDTVRHDPTSDGRPPCPQDPPPSSTSTPTRRRSGTSSPTSPRTASGAAAARPRGPLE